MGVYNFMQYFKLRENWSTEEKTEHTLEAFFWSDETDADLHLQRNRKWRFLVSFLKVR